MDISYLLFDNFETLDLFGPVEVLGRIESVKPRFWSLAGGLILSSQKAPILTEKLDLSLAPGLLVIPGGQGTRPLVLAEDFIQSLKILAEKSAWVLTVCAGSALLAKTGLLDGLEATSNKKAFRGQKRSARGQLAPKGSLGGGGEILHVLGDFGGSGSGLRFCGGSMGGRDSLNHRERPGIRLESGQR